MSVYHFLSFVLVVCSPLLLLSGRTTGYFAGQSTAVVEILQSSAPGQQAAPLISQRLTLFFGGAAVRVKKVEQTALACQQPQLLPTMLPIFILSSICFRIEGHNLKRTINELAQNKQFFRTESKANFYIFPNSLLT